MLRTSKLTTEVVSSEDYVDHLPEESNLKINFRSQSLCDHLQSLCSETVFTSEYEILLKFRVLTFDPSEVLVLLKMFGLSRDGKSGL
ncbi:hypothetical protein L6452_02157 [Arctium lappa]|uniref:Uncharacterized protein n=1 Tax=Arctium lappa TaxID=4217 RepID=A0ACB9FIU7_ARCLA|nr:hypothetical protein L6452_02157 [Arctium lappa]